MSALSDEIIGLAQGISAVSKEQVEKIVQMAPEMPDEELLKLKELLVKLQGQVEEAQKELAIREEVAIKYKEFKSDKAREELNRQESASQSQDDVAAEGLLNNI